MIVNHMFSGGTRLATLILTTVPIDHVAIDHVAIDHVDIDHVSINHHPDWPPSRLTTVSIDHLPN